MTGENSLHSTPIVVHRICRRVGGLITRVGVQAGEGEQVGELVLGGFGRGDGDVGCGLGEERERGGIAGHAEEGGVVAGEVEVGDALGAGQGTGDEDAVVVGEGGFRMAGGAAVAQPA